MNNQLKSLQARELRMTGIGMITGSTELEPMAADSMGRLILSPDLIIPVQSGGLSIRPLNDNQDSVTITASNLDIRNLAGTQDGLAFDRMLSAENSTTSQVPSLGTVRLLTTNVSAYRQNTFYVSNTSGFSIGVSVALEIAPADIDSYYMTDGSSFNLFGGDAMTFQPTRLLKYARIRVTSLLSLANITVYYFGRA